MAVAEIVSISVASLCAGVSIIYNIVQLIRNGKQVKLSSIIANIPTYVAEAEKLFGAGTGASKLSWVLTKVQMDCIKARIDADEGYITAQIESVLNAPEKKKDEEVQTNG